MSRLRRTDFSRLAQPNVITHDRSAARLEELSMDHIAKLDEIITVTLVPLAQRTDTEGRFPREVIAALGQAGLLGLVSATGVGGMGLGLREASELVARVAQTCPSTAMVVCMHYCATVVLEQFGNDVVRKAVAQGRHL